MSVKQRKKEIYSIKTIHIVLIIVFNLFTGATLASAQSYGLYTSEQIAKAKASVQKGIEPQTSAYTKLMTLANNALNKTHHAVKSLKSYQFYGASSSQLKQMVQEQAYIANDSNYAHQLALAYKLTGDEKYAEKAAYFINAWATINKEYIGVGFDRTQDPATVTWKTPYYYNQSNADLNMAESGLGFIQAAILLKDYNGWSNNDKETFSNWCTNVYRKNTDYMLQGPEWIIGNVGVTVRLGIIMHHVWEGDKSVIINEDIPFIKKMLNLQLETLTDAHYNIPDMFPVEVRRGDKGMWYTAWTLASFTAAMEIIHNETGIDLFRWENKNGSTIEKALNRFFIYTKNPSQWPWLDKQGNTKTGISKIPKPGRWGGTLYEAMALKFNNKEWKEWAGGPSVWFSTQLNWDLPSLLQPSVVGETLSNQISNTSLTEESDIPTTEVIETGAFIMDRTGLH